MSHHDKPPYSKRTPVEFLEENWILLLWGTMFFLMCSLPLLAQDYTKPWLFGMVIGIGLIIIGLITCSYLFGEKDGNGEDH